MRSFALAILGVLLLAGCSSSTPPAAVATATQVPATAIPTATATPAPNLQALKAKCGMTDDPHVYLGQHILLAINTLPDFEATYLQVPTTTPPAPYAIQGSFQEQPPYSASFVHQTALLLPFYNGKPHLRLSFVACSIDGQTETVQSMQVTLASFQPYSGNLGIWMVNCTGANYYTRPNGVGNGGCGGAVANVLYTATFTTTQVGAGANLAAPYAAFPHPLPGNGPDYNYIDIDGFSAAGTYTFTLSYTDAQGANHVIPAPLTILTAPVTQAWTGEACETAAMQAQIPASSTGHYICPAS